jgi:hypothetical protein
LKKKNKGNLPFMSGEYLTKYKLWESDRFYKEFPARFDDDYVLEDLGDDIYDRAFNE